MGVTFELYIKEKFLHCWNETLFTATLEIVLIRGSLNEEEHSSVVRVECCIKTVCIQSLEPPALPVCMSGNCEAAAVASFSLTFDC